jgi:hypothetical protein
MSFLAKLATFDDTKVVVKRVPGSPRDTFVTTMMHIEIKMIVEECDNQRRHRE